ncbi:Tumor necrosis factor ligand super member 8 [Saguinus oedipus]|uniref:Tumor necrosis factor ligand super member 8 n=1 Tax=Saguinus oedipus TaxID=9490 RepID=A0ABQ9WFJ7_SAGOE|nr:Tumor necrosis factor ligand super member 8 [Saguinus oedipus]
MGCNRKDQSTGQRMHEDETKRMTADPLALPIKRASDQKLYVDAADKEENCPLRLLGVSLACASVAKHLNQTKLSWNKDGVVHGVRYQDGNLVIQIPGWYVIICQMQFIVQCPNNSVDLKLELLINKQIKKQALMTVCESGIKTKSVYQNLSQFLLDYLLVNTTISVNVDTFQYIDTSTFPLENVLSIFLYSSSD